MSCPERELLLAAAEKLEEFINLTELIFKLGPERFAPATDWWCSIASMRNIGAANVRFLRELAIVIEAQQLRRPLTEEELSICDYWESVNMRNRRDNFVKHKDDSPCKDGCMLTWNKQYGEKT